MKLTGRCGKYAKRITPLIRAFWIYLDSNESMTRDALSHAVSLVRYFKANKIYFNRCVNKVTADTRQEDACLLLDVYIENDVICCNDSITLLFPSIEEVLKYEKIIGEVK